MKIINILFIGFQAFEWSKRVIDEYGAELKYNLADSTPQGKWVIKAFLNEKVRSVQESKDCVHEKVDSVY